MVSLAYSLRYDGKIHDIWKMRSLIDENRDTDYDVLAAEIRQLDMCMIGYK